MINKQEWDAFQEVELNKTEKGKMILCESKEEESTRLFIHQFNSLMSCLTKDGWWDTFTVSKEACNKGFYLCEIDSFRIDKNGYLNVVVLPKKFLGEIIDEDNLAWDFFFRTNLFCSKYAISKNKERFNIDYLYGKFESEFSSIIEEDKKKYDKIIIIFFFI